jgi:hypothetical protein
MNHSLIKPVAAGLTAVALDKYYMNEENMSKSLVFGALVGGGVLASELVAPHIVPDLPSLNSQIYNGKQLGLRITEVASASIGVFAINKYAVRNDNYRGEILKRMGVIVVSDVVAEYIADYLTNQPLSFLE